MVPFFCDSKNEDGTYKGIYRHTLYWLTGVGAMLSDHYKDRKKVEKLILLLKNVKLVVNFL